MLEKFRWVKSEGLDENTLLIDSRSNFKNNLSDELINAMIDLSIKLYSDYDLSYEECQIVDYVKNFYDTIINDKALIYDTDNGNFTIKNIKLLYVSSYI